MTQPFDFLAGFGLRRLHCIPVPCIRFVLRSSRYLWDLSVLFLDLPKTEPHKTRPVG